MFRKRKPKPMSLREHAKLRILESLKKRLAEAQRAESNKKQGR
jgi:hypothetical protein